MKGQQTLKEFLEGLSGSDNAIEAAVADWAVDAMQNYKNCTSKDIIRHLETTDCAACHAPAGLIYNADLAVKLSEWWVEIDDALDEYQQETGEAWTPDPSKGLTFLSYVWFAVEWEAHKMARNVEWAIENGAVIEADKPKKPEVPVAPARNSTRIANKVLGDAPATEGEKARSAAKQPRKPSGDIKL